MILRCPVPTKLQAFDESLGKWVDVISNGIDVDGLSSGGIYDAVNSIVVRVPESSSRPMTGIKIKYRSPSEYKSNWLNRLDGIRKDSSQVRVRV